ncbi:proteasome assembly chaperone 1 isoform X3 [Belonocnema kinseyi]|uniref:proteasome assembly chaperone 1 isoform X3 n=1 Tax=Belonocnema kinseyi TaxID=2817044 RepID=UPI00143DEBF2|nr:proteasome assembly chaperone 1 isoform X3 [Belonocnema kinseyi]
MNPHFGEIVQPSSRAFWLDEDDEELQEGSQEDSKFSIEWLQKEPASFEKLIIVEGNMVVDFTKECILPDAKEICIIKHESHKKSSIIYEVDSSLYICIVSTELDLTEAGGFIDIIHGILSKSKKIIALTNCHVSQLKSNEDCSAPSFLKSLSTKDARNSWKVNAPHLGQPNIISGVAAGALSFAEIKGSYGILFVLYTDNFTLDSKSAHPLVELFSEITNRSLPEFSSVRSVYFNKGWPPTREKIGRNLH